MRALYSPAPITPPNKGATTGTHHHPFPALQGEENSIKMYESKQLFTDVKVGVFDVIGFPIL